MIKKIDFYIIKRYLTTFFVMLLLFIPIGIMVDIAENIDKMKAKNASLKEIITYYLDFTWYFGNLLFPIFLFLAIIWFTSKLANNSEVIAILSSGISFNRYLRPFIIAASFLSLFAFLAGMYIVPKSSQGYNEFRYKYLVRKNLEDRNKTDVYKQISPQDYIYVSNYNPIRQEGKNFSLEHFEDNKLQYKILSNSIRWLKRDSMYRLIHYNKRIINEDEDIYIIKNKLDTLLNFKVDDLSPVKYKAETLNLGQLNQFIKEEKESGSTLINSHLLVRYKRYSLPLSAFVLTLIAVAVSSFKKRGGMGINLAIGILIGFSFVFFDKIFGVLVNKSNFSPFLAAWIPFALFGLLAVILLNHAKR